MDGVPETLFCNVEDIRRRRDVLSRIETSATRYIAFFFMGDVLYFWCFGFGFLFCLGGFAAMKRKEENANETRLIQMIDRRVAANFRGQLIDRRAIPRSASKL